MWAADERWRVQIGPRDGCGPQTFERVVEAVPSTEGYTVDGALVVYVDSFQAAQAVVAAQESGTVLWSDISVWEPDSSLWRSIDSSGDSAVALYGWEIVKTKADGYSRPLEASRKGIGAAVAGSGALAFGVVYLIGGSAGSSIGDHSRDLFQALVVACVAMVVVGATLVRWRKRLKGPAKPTARRLDRPRHHDQR
jgi:hypothetical protein